MHALGVPTAVVNALQVSNFRPFTDLGTVNNRSPLIPMSWSVIPSRSPPCCALIPAGSQLELFARRARSGAHSTALNELKMIVQHLIQRNYHGDIDPTRPFTEQVVELAQHFRDRLTAWYQLAACRLLSGQF